MIGKSLLNRGLANKPAVFMRKMLEQQTFDILPTTLHHTLAEYDLPTFHNDPFRCLLIVWVILEQLTLVTNDMQI